MKSKICYAYDPDTMIYIGESVLREDPMSPGTFFEKDYVTEAKPPECFDDEVACWDADKDKWTRRSDFRGKVYWSTVDKSRHEITEIGKLPRPYWTDQEPFDASCSWSDEDNAWVVPFDVLQLRKMWEIRAVADERFRELTQNYSSIELDSWSRQEAGARLLKANPDSQEEDAAFVRELARARGVDTDVLADKIMAAVQRVMDMTPTIIGTQQALEDRARSATNKEELDAIVWPG